MLISSLYFFINKTKNADLKKCMEFQKANFLAKFFNFYRSQSFLGVIHWGQSIGSFPGVILWGHSLGSSLGSFPGVIPGVIPWGYFLGSIPWIISWGHSLGSFPLRVVPWDHSLGSFPGVIGDTTKIRHYRFSSFDVFG